MTYILLIFSILYPNYSNNNIISKNGMTIEWNLLEEDRIKFKVTSPSKGWLAIGLNTKDELVGSNLIMASVSGNESTISDRYIVGFGDHQSMESLGAKAQVQMISAQEDKNGTTVEFIMNTVSSDPYHFNIERDKQFHLTIAYSREDEFSHHSAMRTSVKIIF